MEYQINLVLNRRIADRMRVKVSAESEDQAIEKARDFLKTYPDATNVDGISFARVDKRYYTEPEIESLEVSAAPKV